MEGTRHLGAAIGSDEFKAKFVGKKIKTWVATVQKISQIAQSQPHAAYATFTHCLQRQWTFVSRSMPGVAELLKPLENEIRTSFIPALLRRNVSDTDRELLSLPAVWRNGNSKSYG